VQDAGRATAATDAAVGWVGRATARTRDAPPGPSTFGVAVSGAPSPPMWEDDPVTETLAPDVVRLPVAPFGLGNAYLLGDVLVDAGFPWSRKRIAGLVRAGRIREHALTHAHADHLGATPWLAEAGVPVAVGARDARALASGEVLTHRSAVVRAMQRPLKPRPVEPTRELVEGDIVGGFEVLEVPGHTPGSLAYWRSSDRVLVVGDAAWHVLPGRASTIPAGFGDDHQAAHRSLRRLIALDPHVVAFGHGQPLRDAAEVERALG
jgi:hydroxyacylglutathione hydrolase